MYRKIIRQCKKAQGFSSTTVQHIIFTTKVLCSAILPLLTPPRPFDIQPKVRIAHGGNVTAWCVLDSARDQCVHSCGLRSIPDSVPAACPFQVWHNSPSGTAAPGATGQGWALNTHWQRGKENVASAFFTKECTNSRAAL